MVFERKIWEIRMGIRRIISSTCQPDWTLIRIVKRIPKCCQFCNLKGKSLATAHCYNYLLAIQKSNLQLCLQISSPSIAACQPTTSIFYLQLQSIHRTLANNGNLLWPARLVNSNYNIKDIKDWGKCHLVSGQLLGGVRGGVQGGGWRWRWCGRRTSPPRPASFTSEVWSRWRPAVLLIHQGYDPGQLSLHYYTFHPAGGMSSLGPFEPTEGNRCLPPTHPPSPPALLSSRQAASSGTNLPCLSHMWHVQWIYHTNTHLTWIGPI